MPKRSARRGRKRKYDEMAAPGYFNDRIKGPSDTVVPKSLQMYPDRKLVTARTTINYAVSINNGAGNNGAYWFQKVANCINTNNFNVNLAGYLGAAVPSGVSYLLGDSNQGGSNAGGNAPYFAYRVHKSRVKVTFLALPNLSGCNALLCVTPLLGYSSTVFQSMGNTQLAEQPRTRTRLINALPYGPAPVVTNECSTAEIYGDRFKSTIENGQYDGNWSSAPSNQWQWVISLQTLAASVANYTLIGTVYVEFTDDIEFFSRNTFVASAGS